MDGAELHASLYTSIEQSLLDDASTRMPRAEVERAIGAAVERASAGRSDRDYFELLVMVVFYSGMKADTVTLRETTIKGLLGDWTNVATCGDADVARIVDTPGMIGNEKKIRACVDNARVFQDIVRKYGSFKAYVATFEPLGDLENLLLLKEEVQGRFAGLGGVTTYHFLMEIGLDVIKPDRVLMRIMERLGLIERRDQLLKAILVGRSMARATNLPIRRIDRVLVAYGQDKTSEFGIERGICTEDKPRCGSCGVRTECKVGGALAER